MMVSAGINCIEHIGSLEHAYLDAFLHQTPDEPLKLLVLPVTHGSFEDGEQPDHALEPS